MKDIQLFYLESFLDSSLLSELIANASGMAAQKVKLRGYLVAAVAKLTLSKSIKIGFVRITSDGARIIEHDKDTSKEVEARPDLTSAAATISELENAALLYIDRAKKYMEENPDVFPPEETSSSTSSIFFV
jgi:hypothetical protein